MLAFAQAYLQELAYASVIGAAILCCVYPRYTLVCVGSFLLGTLARLAFL